MDVFTSTNVVKFSPKLAVEELKMLPNETIGVAVLLKKYEKDFMSYISLITHIKTSGQK